MSAAAGVALALLPWVVLPAVVLWRLRNAKILETYESAAPAVTPMVSIIVPARNEARNIDACLRSLLASTWPAFEVIVVDDHSADGTGAIARAIAGHDLRVRVIDNPDLPDGWFGKQWACHQGALAARGPILLFTDADTRHGPALLTRSMHAMTALGADLFSVGGRQVMETFWERLLQPHIFGLLLARFGNFERMNRSVNPYDKVANGQFMLVSRRAYDLTGGHAAVRSHVAEDLRMAQEWTRLGFSVQVLPGPDSMTTRMYSGLAEIARGWGKNLYAAGRDTIPAGPRVQTMLRIFFPAPALWEIAPVVAMVAAIAGTASSAVGAWGALAYGVTTLYWMVMHRAMRAPLWYALLHPVASVVMFGMLARAAWNGERVEWKGRVYRSA